MGLGAGRWAKLCLLFAAAAGQSVSHPADAAAGRSARSGVGLNLGGWSYYSVDLPMIDQFKRANAWLTQCDASAQTACSGFAKGASSFDTQEQSRLDLDPQGWVRSLPKANDPESKYRTVAALLFHGDGGARPVGRHMVLYEGKGTIDYHLAGKRIAAESRPGRDVVEVSGSKDAGLLITIKATDPRDHIRNIRVIPPGGVCSNEPEILVDNAAACREPARGRYLALEKLLPTQRWHPAFLRDLRGFRALRFMDWSRTNDSKLVAWADRPQPDKAAWTSEDGVPVEAMVDLANATRADPWINLPTRANDEYARQFARTVKAALAPERALYLEYGNEPWNFAFANSHWIKDQAVAKWPGPQAKGLDPYALAVNWYAWRAVELCRIVKAEFGAETSRVKCVANAQAANPWNADQVLSCPMVASQLGGPCSRGFDALAVAPYFGGYLADSKVRDMAGPWLRDADGGQAHLFDELLAERDGKPQRPPLQGKVTAGTAQGALSQAARWMVDAKAVAARHGLPLLAYEGGQHLTPPPGEIDERWLGLLVAANRDPRMGRAYARMLADWQRAGGQLFMFYSHVAMPGRHGMWGLKEKWSAEADPKWQAVLTMRDRQACWWPACAP
jgi:hypothetical protein